MWLGGDSTCICCPRCSKFAGANQNGPGTRYVATGLANSFFSVLIFKDHQKQFAFTWQGQQYTLITLPHNYVNSPALCYNIFHRDTIGFPLCLEWEMAKGQIYAHLDSC